MLLSLGSSKKSALNLQMTSDYTKSMHDRPQKSIRDTQLYVQNQPTHEQKTL